MSKGYKYKAPKNIKPLSSCLGVALHGVDLTPTMNEDTIKTINNMLSKNLLVLLPDQQLSAKELRGVVRRFGELFIHHADTGVIFADGIPEVL